MNIIPKIQRVKNSDGKFMFSASTSINLDKTAKELLMRNLLLKSGVKNEIIEVSDSSLKEEEYRIQIGENVTIKSSTNRGTMRAVASLRQLVFNSLQDGVSALDYLEIADAPKFSYRGYMLDVSRHFFTVDTVKKVLDALWLLKLNVFHLHLSDNQGYRLESDVFPHLHEVGGNRAQTRGDGKEIKGYYTKADIAEIIKYADERGIEVIPEIDMPGHTIAMLAAYPELSCGGKEIKVAERFGIMREIMCAGKESVYEFLFKLLDEIAPMFPSKYFHIGGDEAPKFQWEECPDCNAALKKFNLRDMEDLQGAFTNRIVKHLSSLGKTTIVWNESVYSGILDKSVVCQYWSDGKVPLRVFAAADSGRKTIISKFSPYYLDYPYGMFSLKKTYLFDPLMDGMTMAAKDNVLGVESPLWTEYVTDERKLFYQTFPRLVAVAESGWYYGEKDFDDFKNRLNIFNKNLSSYGVEGASIKESLPNKIKGAAKVAKFFLNAVDKEVLKSALNAKKAKETRRTEK